MPRYILNCTCGTRLFDFTDFKKGKGIALKIKKLQIILGGVSLALVAAIAVTVVQIAFRANDTVKKKKVINHQKLVYVDDDFNDYIDDVINDVIDVVNRDNGKEESEDRNTSREEDNSSITEDNFDWIDPDDNKTDEWNYTSVIQKNGTQPESSSVRNINISTNNVAYSDFYGLGASLFPEILSDDGVSGYYNSVAWEFERQKTINSGNNISRVLIDMDAIISDTEANPHRADYYNNKDYRNYISGIYDFSNDSANSFWEIMQCLKETGTEIILNTGWKGTERTKTWYPDVANDWRDSAPYDINAFIRANIAWLLEAQKRGIDVRYIDFGNEVSWGGDFKTHSDSIAYHTVLVSTMVKALEKVKTDGVSYGYLDTDGSVKYTQKTKLNMNIEMILSDTSNNNGSWNLKLRESVKKVLGDMTPKSSSIHKYYNTQTDADRSDRLKYCDYSNLFDFLCRWRAEQGNTFVTEFFASPAACDEDYNKLNKEHGAFLPGDWQSSYTSFFIACANAGIKGLNAWEFGTSYYPCIGNMKSSNFVDGAGSVFGVGNKKSDYKVATNYRLFSLLANYVPAHSDVLMTEWEGEDIRAASFKLADGNYTFVVEANKADAARAVNLKLDKAVGKLYRYHFVDTLADSENRSLQGILIQPDKEIASSAVISDEIDSGYGVYVYSTKAPAKQVKLDKSVEETEKTQSVQINAELLNCGNLSNIKWEITAASKNSGTSLKDKDLMNDASRKGSITFNGNVCTYTPGSAAQSGDSVAIRATLSDSSGKETGVYSVAVIYIK